MKDKTVAIVTQFCDSKVVDRMSMPSDSSSKRERFMQFNRQFLDLKPVEE